MLRLQPINYKKNWKKKGADSPRERKNSDRWKPKSPFYRKRITHSKNNSPTITNLNGNSKNHKNGKKQQSTN